MDAARLVRRHDHLARIKLHVAHISEVPSRQQNALDAKTTTAETDLCIPSEPKVHAPAGVRFCTFGTKISSIGHFPLLRTISTIVRLK